MAQDYFSHKLDMYSVRLPIPYHFLSVSIFLKIMKIL